MIALLKLDANATFTLEGSKNDIQRAVYLYRGKEVKLNNATLSNYQMASLSSTETLHIHNGDEVAYMLVLQGKPIEEPVAQYGPFVMNTQAEIQQTFQEFQRTQFGGWPWPEREQVHPRDKGRFALHANGTEELPNG